LFSKIVIFLFFSTFLLGAEETSSTLIKQRIEIKELKKELNSFYNKKEKEYQDRKKELETILAQIEKEKAEIKALHDKNLSILQNMEETVNSKTAKIYNSMKPKIAASIFNEMISDGRIEDVFDIILKLKEKKVTLLMKYLSVPNAAKLTLMLEDFKVENEKG
jgi:flagellar motility protein MotE (MotC chaperone)|tara:strand:+ start:1639 stop:2127 length:489 start_codon:yes stop_codon:yes gene_type:complete